MDVYDCVWYLLTEILVGGDQKNGRHWLEGKVIKMNELKGRKEGCVGEALRPDIALGGGKRKGRGT